MASSTVQLNEVRFLKYRVRKSNRLAVEDEGTNFIAEPCRFPGPKTFKIRAN